MPGSVASFDNVTSPPEPYKSDYGVSPMAWIDFDPSDAGLEEFGVRHRIHTLHLEDCRSDEQQAKIEHWDGYLFIVLKLVLLTSDELQQKAASWLAGPVYVGFCRHRSGPPEGLGRRRPRAS